MPRANSKRNRLGLVKHRALAFELLEERAVLNATPVLRFSPAVEDELLAMSDGTKTALPELAESLLPQQGNGNPRDDQAQAVPLDLTFTLSDTFKLHSNPGANHTIYLDFDGHNTSQTWWNTDFHGGRDFYTPAYDYSGSAAFTDDELQSIQIIWQRVVEDFLPFDVDVTTEEPGIDRLRKTGESDSQWGIRVVIGGNDVWYGQRAGGTAYLDSFNWENDTPAFVFEDSLGNGYEKYVNDAISHEIGHSLGLDHDGWYSEEYFEGQPWFNTGWAPIMGAGYDWDLTQWSRGEYEGATNLQDDLEIITTKNGFGYRADDHGNFNSSATPITVVGTALSGTGIIERSDDVDVFSFVTGTGTVSLNFSPAPIGPNLDIGVGIFDSAGNLVIEEDPFGVLEVSLSTYLTAGEYYVHVFGVGTDTMDHGYSRYGSLGFFSVEGTVAEPVRNHLSIAATDASKAEGTGASTALSFTVTRSGDLSSSTSVSYAVTGSGANPASAIDFVGGVFPQGNVVFGVGETSKLITILVSGDGSSELNEEFTVTLSTPSAGAELATAIAVGTIQNDDASLSVAHPLADQQAIEDTPFIFQFPNDVFLNPDGGSFSYRATSADDTELPSWLFFDGTTRTFGGTPENADVGSVSIKLIASDGEESIFDLFVLTVVNSNDPPVLAEPLTNQEATEGVSFTYQIPGNTFQDPDLGDTLSYSATLADGTALPGWLNFDATTRTFHGTPATADIGSISVKVVASDGEASAFDLFDIKVAKRNDGPVVANPIADQTTLEDDVFIFQVPLNTFKDDDVLTYRATLGSGAGLPEWLTFDTSTRTFTGLPTNEDVGSLNLRVIASDGKKTAFDTFLLTVINTNDPPTVAIPIADQMVLEDQRFVFRIPAGAFYDPDFDSELSYHVSRSDGSALPAWLHFDSDSRTFAGTPGNENVGFFSLKIVADDGELSVFETFRLTVVNVNDAPVVASAIADQHVMTDEFFRFELPSDTFRDIDLLDQLTYVATLADGRRLPNWLTFDPNNRSFLGAPSEADVGLFNIRVTASDASTSVSDMFFLTVRDANSVPTVANPISDQQGAIDELFTFQFASNTFHDDDSGTSLSYRALLSDDRELPAWLSFDPLTRTFQGTPTAGDVGNLNIKLIASDGESEVSENFTLSVVPISFVAEVQFRLTLSVIPNPTDPTGQVTALPTSAAWIDEWTPFWAEVWVKTTSGVSRGINAASIQLAYNTSYFSAIKIEPGAFALNVQDKISDSTGQVELTGVNASGQALGHDRYALLARVALKPLPDDPGVASGYNRAGRAPAQPGWLALVSDTANVRIAAAGKAATDVVGLPGTELWPVPYDLDDSGRVGFEDLSLFGALFLQNVADNPAAAGADFDGNGRVDFGDFSLLTANFLQSAANHSSIVYAGNFPGMPEASRQDRPVLTTLSSPRESITVANQKPEAIVFAWPTLSSLESAIQNFNVKQLQADDFAADRHERLVASVFERWNRPTVDLPMPVTIQKETFNSCFGRGLTLDQSTERFWASADWNQIGDYVLNAESVFPGQEQDAL